MPEHKHEIDWVCEGPTWFCKCGAEFYPGVRKNAPTVGTQPVMPLPRRSRLRIRLALKSQDSSTGATHA